VSPATLGTGATSPISFDYRPTEVGRARLGRLTTSHGAIDTPQFMPVGTQATVKSLTPGDLRAAGTQILLGNTYHLSLRPGHERIARLGGLHRFMGWDGPILTDSGGFQVFSLAHLGRVDDDGVTFASHLDGSPHRLTPERAIDVQEALGSDIAMAFDQLVDPGQPAADVERAMERTHAWAERCLAARSRTDQALFGIVQGGVEPALRRRSARAIADLPFDGIAIGGLSVGESKAEMAATLTSSPATGACATSWASGPRRTSSWPWSGAWTCSTVSCPRAWRATARPGRAWASSTCGTLASPMTLPRSTRTAAARPAATTRAPTWRTCSGPRSCSHIASPRSITSPILST
jgi:hypothetical protein